MFNIRCSLSCKNDILSFIKSLFNFEWYFNVLWIYSIDFGYSVEDGRLKMSNVRKKTFFNLTNETPLIGFSFEIILYRFVNISCWDDTWETARRGGGSVPAVWYASTSLSTLVYAIRVDTLQNPRPTTRTPVMSGCVLSIGPSNFSILFFVCFFFGFFFDASMLLPPLLFYFPIY